MYFTTSTTSVSISSETKTTTALKPETAFYAATSPSKRGAGILIGSLAERDNASQPTDRGTYVQRHISVGNPSSNVSTCVGGPFNDDEGAAQCEADPVDQRGFEVRAVNNIPASTAGCPWQNAP